MTIDLGVFVAGVMTGVLIAPFVGWWTYRRLVLRLTKTLTVEAMIRDLQMRRETHDYGSEDLIPENAGPPAEVDGIFEVRPGAMYLEHLSRRLPENRAKWVDMSQDSTKLEESGSQQTNEDESK